LRFFTAFFFILVLNTGICQDSIIDKYVLPFIDSSSIIIHHEGYSFSYNEEHEQANWVAYLLTTAELEGIEKRTDDFRTDEMVLSGTATKNDYSGSGYDRGHLAPAADMCWSKSAMSESFYFSNMSPQLPGFNRGIWKRLESEVRKYGVKFDSIFVATGPIFHEILDTIGKNEVSVPSHYYKALMRFTPEGPVSIGFILPHKPSSEQLSTFVVSIDSLESFSHIDFFPGIPDSIEQKMEKDYCLGCWGFMETKIHNSNSKVIRLDSPKQQRSDNNNTNVQCKGTTQSGDRCRRKTTNKSGYCYQHEK
jgi:endonuclease G